MRKKTGKGKLMIDAKNVKKCDLEGGMKQVRLKREIQIKKRFHFT